MSGGAYRGSPVAGGRLEHRYGPRVHVLSDPWALSLLARLGHPDTHAPSFHHLLVDGFRHLLTAGLVEQLPVARVDLPTRMAASEPRARFVGDVVDPASRIVLVDIARAGMIPSYELQMSLLEIVDPAGIRVDHVYMQRVAEGDDHHVTGAAMAGSKIGGDVDGVTLVIPDPMAATGTSVLRVLDYYANHVGGTPRKVVVAHLIATPEYLRRVTTARPDVEIYCLRVDRGLSPPDVLDAVPGERWDEERGLDDADYIVPGAGGLGELINNAFV